MEDNIVVTKHAEKRIRERLGINKKSVIKNAEKALQFGLDHNELTGTLKKYVDKLYLKQKIANNIKVYGDKAYIFKNNLLITVLPLSNNLVKIASKILKKKESDA